MVNGQSLGVLGGFNTLQASFLGECGTDTGKESTGKGLSFLHQMMSIKCYNVDSTL